MPKLYFWGQTFSTGHFMAIHEKESVVSQTKNLFPGTVIMFLFKKFCNVLDDTGLNFLYGWLRALLQNLYRSNWIIYKLSFWNKLESLGLWGAYAGEMIYIFVCKASD